MLINSKFDFNLTSFEAQLSNLQFDQRESILKMQNRFPYSFDEKRVGLALTLNFCFDEISLEKKPNASLSAAMFETFKICSRTYLDNKYFI